MTKHFFDLIVNGKLIARGVSFMTAVRALSAQFPDATRDDGKPLMTGIDRKRVNAYKGRAAHFSLASGDYAMIIAHVASLPSDFTKLSETLANSVDHVVYGYCADNDPELLSWCVEPATMCLACLMVGDYVGAIRFLDWSDSYHGTNIEAVLDKLSYTQRALDPLVA